MRENGEGERCQVPFLLGVRYPFGGQGLRMVFSNPNCATAFDTEGSEPCPWTRLSGAFAEVITDPATADRAVHAVSALRNTAGLLRELAF